MCNRRIKIVIAFALSLLCAEKIMAQTIYESDVNSFAVSGYLRTGFGFSKDGDTQAHFQMPGALNKYSFGNQADTYGELGFEYTHYLNESKSKSLDALWMVSIFEPFGSEDNMSFNFTEQLYVRANNLFGFGESIWVGNRFYDRKAIYMLDRQWINPGQKGWGGGVENLLNKSTDEDLKFAAWGFRNRDVVSYKNGKMGDLRNYTVDIRWVNKPIYENVNLNLALNFTYRAANHTLDYSAEDGYGAFAWIDYSKRSITNTTALILRQGANIVENHWSGIAQWENPANDNYVTQNLGGAYSVELNNDFLYDDLENFAVNAVFIFVVSNYGTNPYYYEDGERNYIVGRGDMFYWLSVGARAMYYVSDQFRPSLEYTYEYGKNRQLGVKGSLNKITISPELSLTKGYYSRPVLRPFITYAFWSDALKGLIGNQPAGAPYANATTGFTYGVQFEIWW